MPSRYSKYIRLIYNLGDLTAILFSITGALYFSQPNNNGSNWHLFLPFAFFSVAGWMICTNLLGSYEIYRISRRLYVLLSALKTVILYVILFEAGLNLTNTSVLSRETLIYHYILLALSVVTLRLTVTTSLRIYRSRGYNLRRIIIAGHNEMALEIYRFITAHPEYGYKFMGFFSDTKVINPNLKGKLNDIEQYVLDSNVNEIYCCQNEIGKKDMKRLIDFADNNLVRIKILPELDNYSFQKLRIDLYDILPILMVRTIPLDDAMNKLIKRTFDIAFSLTVIVFILSWLLPIIAIAIKLDSKGPIFFKQVRSGINNKNFNCYKLRSMYVNEQANQQLARRGDSRITPVGAFIRKTSIDELPQFFNVLFGHMSIVGPRPHMLKLNEEYAQVADKYMVRHFVKPGITGLSQVRGYRGDTSELYQIRGRVKLDIFYLENWSFILDLKIILYTVLNIFKGDEHAY
ncbi:undecaprenyl-phosphate glucose phosphotransferase [Pontibacter sp. H249]|uniref:undecaprenyl-phosphate glucose phosphotransferase n=1 Tax=Pontibacter sp. H249 TaxID=3133420 RepID=UPI0030C3A971